MLTKEFQINECKEKIAEYEALLRQMPEDTLLGRLCIMSYIKKEQKKLDKLMKGEE